MKKSLFLLPFAILAFFHTINAQAPFPVFFANQTSGCGSFSVQYSGQSVGQVDSWNWSFPGGTPSSSTIQSPTVVYNTPGTYSVTLAVSNVTGSNTATQTNYITVNTTPTAGFTSSVSGSTAAFANTSLNATSYSWNFGDNQTSTQTNPTHTYTQDGNYTVTLSATNACGTSTYSTVVQVGGCGPIEVLPLTVNGSGQYVASIVQNGDTTTSVVDVTSNCPPVPPVGVNYIFANKNNWTPTGTGATICKGDSLYLTATEGNPPGTNHTYQWYPFYPTKTGKTIKVRSSDLSDGYNPIVCNVSHLVGVYNSYNFTVNVITCLVGNEDPVAEKVVIGVAPNPSNGNFLIELPEEVKTCKVSVTNIWGQVVKGESQQSSDFSLDLSHCPAGTYFLQITCGNDIIVRKLEKI